MPAPLPPEITAAIIILFLEGLTRDAIADKLGISQGSVSNVLNNLKNIIGESTFNILKELGKHLQQNDVSFDDAIICFHIKSLLKKLGVDVEKIKSFVESFYSACIQNGVQPTVAITTIKKIIDIEKDAQIPFEELPQKYQNILDQIKTAEDTLATLNETIAKTKNEKSTTVREFNKKIQQLEQRYDNLHQKYNVSVQKLEFYTGIFESLKKKNIPIEDTEKFAKMMANAQNLGYDAKIIISQIQASNTHHEDLKKMQEEMQQLQAHLRSAKSELGAILKQKEEVSEEVELLYNERLLVKKQVKAHKQEIYLLTTMFKVQQEEMLRSYCQNITQAKLKALTEFQYFSSDMKVTWEKFIEQQKLDAQNSSLRLDESCQKLNEKCIEYGQIKNHAILAKIIEGTGDPHEILSAMVMILQRFKVWVGKSELKSSEFIFRLTDTLIDKIQEGWNDISKNTKPN